MKPFYKLSIIIPVFSILIYGCKKDWLEAKPNTSLVVPETVKDYQALLDNNDIFNTNEPSLGLIAGDQFNLTSSTWQSVSLQTFKYAFIWADDTYNGEEGNSGWQRSYSKILYANIALEGIDKLADRSATTEAINNVKGSALFFRAYEFYNLSQLFCKPYNPSTAGSDLGLPLRLSPDINIPSVRSSLQQTYDQIILDMEAAGDLLPVSPVISTRPSKQAAKALLARIYLSMERYPEALELSDEALGIANELIDFRNLNPASSLPFPNVQTGNKEVIFYAQMQGNSMFRSPRLIVDSGLYAMYDSNDLRKAVFFSGSGSTKNFKGYYTGSTNHFAGLAVDEMYLIRAECSARAGNVNAAMQDLNFLLQSRYDSSFVPLTAATPEDALALVLRERKKELLFRGLRWSDLRRLNKDDRFKETLHRAINNENYFLLPGDPRYTFLIPPEIIRLGNLEQNPR